MEREPAAIPARRSEEPASLDLPAYDGGVLFAVGALMTLGVVMVFSASIRTQGVNFDVRSWWNSPLKQCIFAVAGFLTMLVAAHTDHRWLGWQRPAGWLRIGGLYVLAVALLVAVLIPGIGTTRLGAARAIVVMTSPISISFQPSELAKVVLTIWMAALLTRAGFEIRSFSRGYVPAIASAGLLVALTGIEDFGTAALMGCVTLVLLIVGGARLGHILLTGLAGLAFGALLIWHKPYRWERIQTFFASAGDAQNEAYQVNQSLNAIGLGGWWGRGLGASIQKQGYLPQINNDFIFALVCEEIGVIGGLVVVGLFLLLLWRGWRIAGEAETSFAKLLATGLTLTLCLQAALNIAVVTDSVPTKGISLPFVSAGGSGVLFLGLAAGILASIWRGPGRLRGSA